eukprot:COSAG03_NODE_3307_length_2092_cov_1.566483_1_plen_117_part_10
MRVSINQDLIDQIKLYTFPPPHDTRVAQQAFIFSGGGAETLPSSVPAAAADDSSPPEAAAAVSAARDSGKGHFGDRDLGFEENAAEDELPAANKRAAEARSTAAASPGRLSLVQADD